MIAGTTYDGHQVDAQTHKLEFVFLDVGHCTQTSIGFTAEFNRTAKGKLRPYYLIWLGRIYLTGGWLFGEAK